MGMGMVTKDGDHWHIAAARNGLGRGERRVLGTPIQARLTLRKVHSELVLDQLWVLLGGRPRTGQNQTLR